MNSETKTCQNCRQNFVIEPEDFDFYKKINVPPPTWCWRCRAMRRMAFYNINCLHERTCAATGKKIFTTMPPSAPMPVYSTNYWLSDKWNPLDYRKDYDFKKTFFEQFCELFNTVPWSPMWNYNKTNSEYSVSSYLKNCYLCFDCGFLEDSAYSVTLLRSKRCFDMVNCKSCELCYYCINTNDSYKTFFSRNCTSCVEVWLSQDCIGCNNCFGCTGLRNKNYHIFNKPYTKEAYQEELKKMKLDSWDGSQSTAEKAFAAWKQYPVKYQHSVQAQGCTGDYIYNSNQLRNCFFAGNAQNCFHSQSIIYGPIKDSADITSSGEVIELFYETGASGDQASNIFFSFDVSASNYCWYSTNCRQSNNLFGCVGVRGKNYCILNKQYSKEDFFALREKIIRHMDEMPYTDAKGRVYRYGEFFPPEVSPFGYNETQAYEYFPLTQKEAESRGYHWRAPEMKHYSVTKTSEKLPQNIHDVSDDIVGEIIQCLHHDHDTHSEQCRVRCSTAFRITAQELQFYRQMNLPLPRLCFYCRHFERVAWRNKPQLYKGKCMCSGNTAEKAEYQNGALHFHGEHHCPNEFETSYAPDRPEIVYCEQCYNSEVT
ncbi:MAG: hypothetical protein A3B13_02005 [Candidatus Liptonbacteria bacterium RIFCSPLOWO2_01_FULL_45_15]|uniref:Uncharacterized protein n=1 Tax=Candidatus Liptonbacteria bacterium RIFCSPLOWO2_01_FULL_45_15 TaxID=1798649 RepID=A0A1G2CGS8_9BACT|nr:MAG: hypothetical protein A3B13_02005 [Candidatus Liptonbacteria bacterium RIFCSPLOWO2_01_FULL_45_15]